MLINKVKEEDMELKGFKMAINLKVSGQTTKQMAKENIGMLMVIIMKDIGLMIRLMEKVYTHLQMDLAILENGKTICSTDRVKKPGKIILTLLENM
jgi:hypothetical protein